jgi:hypothetical protein
MDTSTFDRIERYLAGKMNAEEKKLFTDDLQKDPELNDLYNVVKAEHEAMELLVADKLRSDIASWKSSPPVNPFEKVLPEKKSNNANLKKISWIIGTLMVIMVAVYFLMTEYKKTDEKPADTTPTYKPAEGPVAEAQSENEENFETKNNGELQENNSDRVLYAYAQISQKYYERPTSLFGSLRSGEGDDKEQNFDLAVLKFSQNDLKGALRIIEKEDGKESKVIFLKACLFFEMKKYKQAAGQFEKIANDELSPFYEETNWYLMLSYLAGLPSDKQKFDAVSKKILNSPDNYYYEKTKELIGEVK